MLTLLLLPAAWSHADGRLDGVDVHELAAGEIALEASFGLLWSEDAESALWHCHEAITAPDVPITPRYALSESGVILGLVPDVEQARDAGLSLYRSTDGCSWNPAAGLEGLTLAEVSFSPADADLALVTTATAGDGVENGVLGSVDGGLSFTSVLAVESRLFGSVQFSEAGGVWASASWSADDKAWVYTSPDGLDWTEHEVPLRDLDGRVQTLDIVATSATDPLTAWLVAGPFGDDVLLRTTDGAETFEEVFRVSGDILDAAFDASGGMWLAVSGRDYYYAADGESFAQVETAPRGMGLGPGEESVWMALDAILSGNIAAEVIDAEFRPRLHLSALELRECPEGSHGALFCDPLWPELAGRLPFPPEMDTGLESGDTALGDTAIESESDSTTRCGCGAKSSAALLLPLLFAGARRRED